jgi:hypothetical protein
MHFRKVHMLDAWCLDNERSNAQETTRPTSQLQKSAPKCGVIKHRTFNVVSTTMVIYHQTLQMDNQDQWKWGGSSHSLEGLSKTNENLRISASQLAFKPGTSWTQVSSNTAQATDMAWNPLQVPRIKINLKKSTTNVTNNESNTHLCYTSIITEHFWRQNYHLYVKKKINITFPYTNTVHFNIRNKPNINWTCTCSLLQLQPEGASITGKDTVPEKQSKP